MAKTKRKKSKKSRNSNKSKLGGARLPARSNRSHILRSDRETLNLAKERFDKQLGPFNIENELFQIMRNNPDLDEDEFLEKYNKFERINFLIRKLEDEHSKAVEWSFDGTPQGLREPIANKGSLFKEARSRFKTMQRSELAMKYKELAKERFDKQLGPFDIENELFKIMRNDPDLDEDELFKKYKKFVRINFLIKKLEDEHSKEGK